MPQILCARCQRNYLDQYDSCPWCGLRREKPPSNTGAVGPAPRPSAATVAPQSAAPQAATIASAPIAALAATSGESLTLGRVLITVAVIWGFIGIANVVEVYSKESSSAMRSFAFFFGVLFFLFPSLAFFAWGSSRNSRIKSTNPAIWSAAAGVTGLGPAYGASGVQEIPVWQLAWYATKLPFEKLTTFLQMAIVPIAISFALTLPYALF